MEERIESIAEKHRRLRTPLIAAVGVVAFVVSGTQMILLEVPDAIGLLGGLFCSVIAVLNARHLVPRYLLRSFARSFQSAELLIIPSPIEAELRPPTQLTANGFVDQGTLLTVGIDGTVFAGPQSRYLFHAESATIAVSRREFTTFWSELSDGKTLVTSSVHPMPHPDLLIQGASGKSSDVQCAMHRDALERLSASGVYPESPQGGFTQGLLRSSLREQEWARSLPAYRAADEMTRIVNLPLPPLALA